MAATILTVGSKFNPLSFDEMAKPLMMYKQEADKIETAINDYTEKGDVIGSLINPQQDIQSANIYNKFRNEAQLATDNFYNNGLNPDIRKQLLNLRRSYADNMTKIQAAYTAREKERAMQNELKAKDPTMMFSRDANYESLDSYLMGEQPTYKSVSGDYLYKLGLQAGKSASTRQDLTIEARKALENTYWELKEKKGFTDSQALEWMSERNPMFKSIVSNIRNGSNIDSLNPNDQEIANSAILNGILSGLVGEQKVDYKPVINVNVNTGNKNDDKKDDETNSLIYTRPSITGNTSNVRRRDSKQINKNYEIIKGYKPLTGIDGKKFITSKEGASLYASYKDAFNNRINRDITEKEIINYKYTPEIDISKHGISIPTSGRAGELYRLHEEYNKFKKEQDSFKNLIKEQGTKGSYLGDYGDEGFTNAQLYTALQEKQRASEYGIYNLNLQTSAGNNVSMNLGNLITSVGTERPVLFEVSSGKLIDDKGKKSSDFTNAQLSNAVISRDTNGRLIATIRDSKDGTTGKTRNYYVSGDEAMKSAEEVFNITKSILNNFNEGATTVSTNLIGGTSVQIPGIRRTEDRAEVDNPNEFMREHLLSPFTERELAAYNAQPVKSSNGNLLYNVIDIESGEDIIRVLIDPNGYPKHISSLYDTIESSSLISDYIDKDNRDFVNLMKQYYIQK